jgi:hypothetical protein
MRVGKYIYRAFGLRIRSDHRFDEFVSDEADPKHMEHDFRILVGGECSDRTIPPTALELGWNGVGSFWVEADRIQIYAANGVPEKLINLPMHGPVFATALQMRGRFVLHAAAVAVGDTCVILAGHKRAGKSTLLAYFLTLGYQLIADDVVSMDIGENGSLCIYPSFPSLKVDPKVLEWLDLSEFSRFDAPVHDFPKAMISVSRSYAATHFQKCKLFILEQGHEVDLSRMSTAASLANCLEHCYKSNAIYSSGNRSVTRDQFSSAVRVVASAAVYKVSNPRRMADLKEILKRIIDVTSH